MKKNLRTLAIFFLMLALIFIGLFASKEVLIAHIMPSSEQVSAKTIAKNQKKPIENKNDVKALSLTDVLDAKKSPLDVQKETVGVVNVPDVGIDIAILNGTNNRNLMYGATTYNENQKMGQGNYVLFGHHFQNESILFGPLGKIQNGNKIILSDLNYNYEYRVYEKKDIKDTDIKYVDPTKENIVTLITCDVSYSTDKRIMVRGKFVKKTPVKQADKKFNISESNDSYKETGTYKLWLTVMIISFSLAFILLILIIWRLFFKKNKKH